ncbi:MAG: hypothetical protein M1839_006766 [Geoglossum umbratile]|nr:MAG: hypothetical protein M1839_006766 [Geoglossum umbratile]
MSLLPPSEGNEYLDQKSMINAIQQYAKSNGYADAIAVEPIDLTMECVIGSNFGIQGHD